MIALYLVSASAITTIMASQSPIAQQMDSVEQGDEQGAVSAQDPDGQNGQGPAAQQIIVDAAHQVATPPTPAQTQPNLVQRAQLPETGPRTSSSPFSVHGGASLLSDYTLRGVSLDERKPAVQGTGELGYTLPFGLTLYAGIIATTASKHVAIGSVELDPYGAIGFKTGKAVWKLTSYRIMYPSSRQPMDFNEQTASVTMPVGPVGVTLFYLHDRYRGGGHSNWGFVQTAYAIPRSHVSVRGSIGYEDGDTWNGKINWTLGAFYNLKHLTFGLQYVDTNKNQNPIFGDDKVGGARPVFSVTASF